MNVYAKFRNDPLHINKALGIFQKGNNNNNNCRIALGPLRVQKQVRKVLRTRKECYASVWYKAQVACMCATAAKYCGYLAVRGERPATVTSSRHAQQQILERRQRKERM